MRKELLVLTAAVCAAGAANGQSYTAAELRQGLQLWSDVGNGKLTISEQIRVGRAIGFIDGFTDAYLQEKVRGARLAKDDAYTFCLPREFSNGDLRRTATSYLERRREPHIDQAPASAVLAMAFNEAYPCRKR